jgi:hypothetical protein
MRLTRRSSNTDFRGDRQLLQMVTDWLAKHRPTPEVRLRSHDIHDTMPELRPYKGRRQQ